MFTSEHSVMNNSKRWLELGLIYHLKPKNKGVWASGWEASYEKGTRKVW